MVMEEWDINVIGLEEDKIKGKGKVMEIDTMPIKRAHREEIDFSQLEEAKTNRKTKEVVETSKKKIQPQCHIDIGYLMLGKTSEPYNLIDDVSGQGPRLAWPQLLHLAPKVHQQWSKMVSTRRGKVRPTSLIKAHDQKDVVPTIEAHIKVQRIYNVYVNGGAQMCVMSEKFMHHLGLEVSGKYPSRCGPRRSARYAPTWSGSSSLL